MSPALQDGLVIGARRDPLETEADRIADRIAGAPADGSRTAALSVQRLGECGGGSGGDRAPVSVDRVLSGFGRALEPALREDVEQRFGRSLSRVRLVRQSGSRGYLQRASPASPELSTTEGQLEPGPEQPPASAGLGLDQPDCSTRVTDVFWLGPTSVEGGRPECGFAEIHLLADMSRSGYVRADHPLPAIPCKSGDTTRHGTWLRYGSDEWRVLEVRNGGIDVMNACGEEETLGIAGEPPPKPASGPPPDTSVEVKDGTLGAGRVETWGGCKRVAFTPDKAGPTRVYNLEVVMQPRLGEMRIYVIEGGDKIPYAPHDLEGMLGVVLAGDNCGQPLSPPPPPPEPEQLPGTFSD